MAYASAEKEFYQRHYDGGLLARQPWSLDEIREMHFAPGKRYHLLCTELDAKTQYGTAVEVGCANGEGIVFLANKFRFEQAIGIDIGFPDDMQREADGVKFVHGNANLRLPLEDGSVDVLVAMMVIEHLFDPFRSFSEVKRVLAPGGMAVINLPLVTSIKNRLRLLFGKVPVTSVPFERWLSDREWDGNHLHYFSLDSIHKLADSCGLKVTRVAGVGAHHRLKSVAPRLFANELSFVVKHSDTTPASG